MVFATTQLSRMTLPTLPVSSTSYTLSREATGFQATSIGTSPPSWLSVA